MQSSIVSKLLNLLTVISQSKKPMVFSELVAESGLNKSTIHRLLAICTEEGLVQFDEQRKTYLLGSKVFDLVRSAYNGYDIQAVALDEMMRLHSKIDANVTLGVPKGMEVVYLRVLESRHELGALQRPGMSEPMHCSASGKAILAFLPPAVTEAKLIDYMFRKFTKRTITDRDKFLKALRDVRKKGYATNDREEYDHFFGVSAPIFNYLSEPIAVLNMWAVHPRQTLSDLKGWAPDLLSSARRVTRLIGGVAPSVEQLGKS